MKVTYHQTQFTAELETTGFNMSKFVACRDGKVFAYRSATGVWIPTNLTWTIGPRVTAKIANGNFTPLTKYPFYHENSTYNKQ